MDWQGLRDGALFAASAPLALGAVLAACLACAPRRPRAALVQAALLAASSLLARVLPDTLPATPSNAAVLFVLGAFLAANQQLAGRWTALALVPAGLVAGLVAGLATATPSEAAGSVLVLAVLAVALLLVRVPAPVQHGASIARRMAGAWIAAVGVLMVALWLRGVA